MFILRYNKIAFLFSCGTSGCEPRHINRQVEAEGQKGDFMAEEEGSVFVDGIDADVDDTPDETTTEPQVNNSQESQETTEESQDQQQEPQLTEKGTKLDPNPESAVHQQLANAKRAQQEMEQLLSNPQALQMYMAQRGFQTEQPKQEPKAPLFSADKFQTTEDVVNALNSLNEQFEGKVGAYEKTISELQGQVKQLSEGREIEQRAFAVTSDISRARETYPELNKSKPEYNEALEKSISSLYHKLDWDEQRNTYRGNVSLMELAKEVIGASRAVKQSGYAEAQTIIKDKSMAKVVTSGKGATKEEAESKDPAVNIARKINQMFK